MPPKKNQKPTPSPATVATEPDTQDNFEEELLWCIKKLEAFLLSENITAKSLKSTVLALKTLKSSKAPFVKKRQVMRMSCGDYRKAMEQDLKKVKIDGKKMSLLSVTDSKKGTLISTSTTKAGNAKEPEEKAIEDSAFCFNFPVPEKEELRLNLSDLKID